jgi:hypothetical protein
MNSFDDETVFSFIRVGGDDPCITEYGTDCGDNCKCDPGITYVDKCGEGAKWGDLDGTNYEETDKIYYAKDEFGEQLYDEDGNPKEDYRGRLVKCTDGEYCKRTTYSNVHGVQTTAVKGPYTQTCWKLPEGVTDPVINTEIPLVAGGGTYCNDDYDCKRINSYSSESDWAGLSLTGDSVTGGLVFDCPDATCSASGGTSGVCDCGSKCELSSGDDFGMDYGGRPVVCALKNVVEVPPPVKFGVCEPGILGYQENEEGEKVVMKVCWKKAQMDIPGWVSGVNDIPPEYDTDGNLIEVDTNLDGVINAADYVDYDADGKYEVIENCDPSECGFAPQKVKIMGQSSVSGTEVLYFTDGEVKSDTPGSSGETEESANATGTGVGSDSATEGSTDLDTPLIIGIVVLGALVLVGVGVFIVNKQKKSKRMQRYSMFG